MSMSSVYGCITLSSSFSHKDIPNGSDHIENKVIVMWYFPVHHLPSFLFLDSLIVCHSLRVSVLFPRIIAGPDPTSKRNSG